MTWLSKSNHGMMILKYTHLVAPTMFYLSMIISRTISVPCVKRGRHLQH